MKKMIDKIKFWSPLLLQYLLMFAAIGLSLWLTYAIFTSDMPNWLKFWLLG